MERQKLIISLLLITLIVNVVLGIELYYALHKPSQPIAQTPLNISGLQIETSNTSTLTTTTATTIPTSTTTKSSTISPTTATSPSLYNFSFKVKFKLHVDKKGVYIIGIKPNITFASLYVLIYFDDGNTVVLSLNHSTANITFSDKNIEVTAYIEGSAYQNLTPTEILDDLGLYLKFVSAISQNNDD